MNRTTLLSGRETNYPQPRSRFCTLLILPAVLSSTLASANLSNLAGTFSSDLVESAARANQQTYSALIDSGCSDDQGTASVACSGSTFTLFENVRELVHTANELTNTGPTFYSLGSDAVGLGFALQWTAGEEFAAQGSMSSDFVNSQLSGLASRLTALRFGASGFNLVGINYGDEHILANTQAGPYGGGASADSEASYSKWGGFLNGAYGYGDKKATNQEDAFDFDGFQINGGLDYRLSDTWVVGAVLGFTEQEVDFDSSQSIVDGGITSDGFSVLPFFLYQDDQLFGSLSIGYQQMSFDSDRAIRYPSFNPNSGSVDTRALGSTDSSTISLHTSLGYSFRKEKFAAEPYIELNYLDISIDGFTERDINNAGFDLRVDDQNITSSEVATGLNVQYTLTPSFGVFVPYLDFQLRSQFETDNRELGSGYAATSSAENFNITTDELDDQYYVITIGLSTVLRGSRQTAVDGPLKGGISAFFNYKTIEDLENFTQEVISGGIRYEF